MVERGGGPTGHHNHRAGWGTAHCLPVFVYDLWSVQENIYAKGWLEMYILNNSRQGWLMI